jgi:hypothetical protein
MLNHNRAPKTVAIFAGAGLALAACTSSGGEVSPTQPPAPAVTTPAEVPPKDASHSKGCDGKISGWRDVTFTKDGEEYQITDIEGGTCAGIYDNETPSRKLLGSVSVGTGIISPCTIGAEKSYLRILTSNLQEANGQFAGTEFVGDVATTRGAMGPLPDCGAVPGNGFIITP